MQSPHLASHCPLSYKTRELHVLHCVKLYFFPFLFSWPFFQHPSSILRSELQRAPPTVPKMWPLLAKPLCRKQLCIPPQIFLPQTIACFCECVTSQKGCKLTQSLGRPRACKSTVTHVGCKHLPILASMQLSVRNTQTHMAVYFLLEQDYFTLLGYPVTGNKHNSQM